MTLVFLNESDETAVESLCDNVRYLLSLTITEEEVPNEIILGRTYLGASSQEIALRLDFSDQISYDNLTEEQQRRILTALEYRITAKLLSDLPKILSEEKLENGLKYNEWDITELKLIYLRLIEKELWEFRDNSFDAELEEIEASGSEELLPESAMFDEEEVSNFVRLS